MRFTLSKTPVKFIPSWKLKGKVHIRHFRKIQTNSSEAKTCRTELDTIQQFELRERITLAENGIDRDISLALKDIDKDALIKNYKNRDNLWIKIILTVRVWTSNFRVHTAH